MLQRELMKSLRLERGFSQRGLCQGICPRSTYASFEKEGYALSSDLLLKLLERLNVTPEEFVSRLKQGEREQDQVFDKLMALISGQDGAGLTALAQSLMERFAESGELTWLVYGVKAKEGAAKIAGVFDPLIFKKQEATAIETLKSRLYQVRQWERFEFALFANLALYLTDDEVIVMIRKLEGQADLFSEPIQELYIKTIFNCTVRLLESQQYELILRNLTKVRLFSQGPDTLYHQVMVRYYQTLCQELQEGAASFDFDFLLIFDEMGMKDYREKLLGHRKRLWRERG